MLFLVISAVEFVCVYYATIIIIKNPINKKRENPEYGLNGYIGLLLFSLSACLLNVLNL